MTQKVVHNWRVVRHSQGSALETVRMSALLAGLFALLLVPIFAHGCHGDDVDREPSHTPIHTTITEPQP